MSTQVRSLATGLMFGAIVGLIGMVGASTHNHINNLNNRINLLEQKLADSRAINDELSADNEALVEENVLWRIHSQAVCSDAMSKPPAADDESLKLHKSVYWY